MKNRPPVSLPAFPAVIGRKELASPESYAPEHAPYRERGFQFVQKCTTSGSRDVFRLPFLGFRNSSAGALLKPFRNFWAKFIPETGTSYWNPRKA
jgi:hypothetical protein